MDAFYSLLLFLGSFMVLLWYLRRGDRLSLGLPIAYLLALSLEHTPGAWAYWVTKGMYGSPAVERGIFISAVGAACFTAGVVAVNTIIPRLQSLRGRPAAPAGRTPSRPGAAGIPRENGPTLWVFCLIGGWSLVFGLNLILRFATVGAIIEKGGAIWMLGVMLGLAYAMRRGDLRQALMWLSALAVYPIAMLVLAGFMSYGALVVIISCSILTIVARSYLKVLGVVAVVFVLAINIFVNYFAARVTIRDAVWGGASIDRRIDVILDSMADAHIFSTKNPNDLEALDLRLNQNYFIGLAADRLDSRYVGYLNGQSLVDGVISLIPRAIWPEKPVYGGSPEIVRKMTGLNLNKNTSWGVGQVMEFYINFAMPGLVVGFLFFGALLGWLDRQAATMWRTDATGKVFLYLLPAIALIQPIGSIVELTGGAGAALGAAFLWRFAWQAYIQKQRARAEYARLIAGYR